MHARFFVLLASALVGCGASHAADAEGALVVGVQSEDLSGLAASVHVVTKIDGVVTTDDVLDPVKGLPKEVPLRGRLGGKVDVDIDARAPNAAPGAPSLLSRHASAHLVGVAKKLLRVVLEQRCAHPLACPAPLTCVSGGCVSGDVEDPALEDYSEGWGLALPDICRPANHGPPDVALGTGQTDYGTLTDEQVLSMELGPQGGHHIWMAARMKNLRQSGTISALAAKVLDDPTLAITPAAFVFSFSPDEGGYCKIYGLRFQLDAAASDLANAYKPLLGKRIAVTVTLTDSTKATASQTKIVHLADKLVCPDGTDACNAP